MENKEKDKKFDRVFLLMLGIIFTQIQAKENNMNKNRVVLFETTQRVIEFPFKPDVAPKACENFTKLVEAHYTVRSRTL
jgi:hypothetical protein